MQPAVKWVGERMEGARRRGEATAQSTGVLPALFRMLGAGPAGKAQLLEETRTGMQKSSPSIRGAPLQPSHTPHVTAEATVPIQKHPRKQRAPGESASPSRSASPRRLQRRWPCSSRVHCPSPRGQQPGETLCELALPLLCIMAHPGSTRQTNEVLADQISPLVSLPLLWDAHPETCR